MTESAVERLTEKAKEHEWDWVDVHPFDLRSILSERAELLATVERMRGGLKKITTNYGPRHLAHQIARAALTTGEVTNAGERG